MAYIHQHKDWPNFTWDIETLSPQLVNIRYKQGKLLGAMEALGFKLRDEAFLEVITTDVLKTSEIEGELLNQDQVRSSVARHLDIHITRSVPSGRDIDGIVEMLLDAAQNYDQPLTKERLFQWHSWLFPDTGKHKHLNNIGNWRDGKSGPMQVVSGAIGREKIHFEAPHASKIVKEMTAFLKWFNTDNNMDAVLKAAIAHFWFVTIHPFEDGNGRIARAIADMQLSRVDRSPQRFYSMSARIQKDWKGYYAILEEAQSGDLDITDLLYWFLESLDQSLHSAEELLSRIRKKSGFWESFTSANLNERQKLMLNKLLDDFEGKLTTAKWAKITKCSHDTALRDIQDLIEKGILARDESGGRSTGYMLVLP